MEVITDSKRGKHFRGLVLVRRYAQWLCFYCVIVKDTPYPFLWGVFEDDTVEVKSLSVPSYYIGCRNEEIKHSTYHLCDVHKLGGEKKKTRRYFILKVIRATTILPIKPHSEVSGSQCLTHGSDHILKPPHTLQEGTFCLFIDPFPQLICHHFFNRVAKLNRYRQYKNLFQLIHYFYEKSCFH